MTGISPGTARSLLYASVAFFITVLIVLSKNDFGVDLRIVGRAPWMRVLEPMIRWLMHRRPFLTSSANMLLRS